VLRAGYQLERSAAGPWEIRGYSREFIEAVSPEGEAIKREMKKRGLAGFEAKRIVALDIREKKDESLTPELMRAETLRRATEHGIDPVAIREQAARRQQEAGQAEDPWKAAHASLTYAREHVFEREAVNGERKLIAEALKRSMGETGLHEIRGALDSRLRAGEFVAVEDRGIERSLTTQRMIELESSNLARLGFLADASSPLVSRAVEPSAFANLSAEQRRAVQEILGSTGGVTALEARAGTGKTSRVLATVKVLAEADGYTVRGIAPTSRATKELRGAGIESSTLQKFLVEKNGEAEGKRLVVLDEASLASTMGMHELLNRIGPGDRLLVCGDSKQHEAVEAGAPFRALQKAGVKVVKLEALMRQQDPALKHAVELLAEGNTKWAVGELIRQGRVTEVANSQERLLALAKDFGQAPEGTLAVAPSNEERMQLNQAIRTELQSRGLVSPGGEQVKVLVPRNELTGAGRAWAGRYEAGDVIRYSSGSAKLGIKAGEYARVVGMDRERNLLTVSRADGEVTSYDPRRLRGVSVFKEVDRVFAAGDRLQLTAPFNGKRIANRELATVEQIEPAGNLALRLDSGDRVAFNLREHPCVDYGYAATSHSSQGATAERVLILADSAASKQLVNQRLAYVAVSRAASDVRIYTDSAGELVSKLSRENSKTMVLDYDAAQPKVAKRSEMALEA
jgi:ATP-dependent exoDNAse (exonuclease V) alpha subunit